MLEESNGPLALNTREIADGKVIKTVNEKEELEKSRFNNCTTERLVKRQVGFIQNQQKSYQIKKSGEYHL